MSAGEEEKPLNREPPVKELIKSFITDEDLYDRNHGPIPRIAAENHTVHVDGAVKLPLELSIAQLRNDFKQYDVICVLQCAGNRRHTMRTLLKEVQGIDWGDGAVMNCRWRGPKLKDILDKAGINIPSPAKAHVAFASFQECEEDSWYGGSIELDRAMDESCDVLLALEMNGKSLPVNHGYPVRVVVPGVAGARCVKWLDKITVQLEESRNHYQQLDYKILPPEATDKETARKYWGITPAMQGMPINSVIAEPQIGETVKLSRDGSLEVKGYALPSGHGAPIVKVEVSMDNGRIWRDAEIIEGSRSGGKWAWTLWRTTVKLAKGQNRRVLSRATDTAGHTQEAHPQWNLRGVGYNGYGESRDLTVV